MTNYHLAAVFESGAAGVMEGEVVNALEDGDESIGPLAEGFGLLLVAVVPDDRIDDNRKFEKEKMQIFKFRLFKTKMLKQKKEICAPVGLDEAGVLLHTFLAHRQRVLRKEGSE